MVREEHGTDGALCTEAEMLSTDLEQVDSDTGLRAASLSKAFRQMSLSF